MMMFEIKPYKKRFKKLTIQYTKLEIKERERDYGIKTKHINPRLRVES